MPLGRRVPRLWRLVPHLRGILFGLKESSIRDLLHSTPILPATKFSGMSRFVLKDALQQFVTNKHARTLVQKETVLRTIQQQSSRPFANCHEPQLKVLPAQRSKQEAVVVEATVVLQRKH